MWLLLSFEMIENTGILLFEFTDEVPPLIIDRFRHLVAPSKDRNKYFTAQELRASRLELEPIVIQEALLFIAVFGRKEYLMVESVVSDWY